MAHVKRPHADQLRKHGVHKLLCQLTILEHRVRSHSAAMTGPWSSLDEEVWTMESLILDVETYYTVANDLLKLAVILLPKIKSAELKREPVHKTICQLRNELIRHAYDKENGDPNPGWGWSANTGVRLKPGNEFSDPGFFRNQEGLATLLDKYELGHLVLPGRYQHITGHLKKMGGIVGLAECRLPGIHYSPDLSLRTELIGARVLPVISVGR